VEDKGKGNQPTLRRTAGAGGAGDSGQQQGTQGDDQPTLHRRDD